MIKCIVVLQSPSPVWLFTTPWTAAHQASLFLAIRRSLPKFMSIEMVRPSNHLILYHLFFSCPQSFRASCSFLVSRLFASGGQSIGASVLPSSLQWIFRVDFLQDWLIWSLSCPKDSQEFSAVSQFKSINSLVLSLLYVSTLTSIHDYWKNYSFWLYGPLLAKWCLCFLICCLGLL